MTANKPRALLLPVSAFLLASAFAACTPKDDRPAPPQTGEPAAPAAVTPAPEDRGHQQPGETAAPSAPAAPDHAFSGVEAGAAERAASQRGRDSAGEAPASGGGQ